MIAISFHNNIHNNNYYCNYHIADEGGGGGGGAAAAAAVAVDDDVGNSDGYNFLFASAVDKHVDDDFIVQHDHQRHHTHACPYFLTPAAAGGDIPPYTRLLCLVTQKLQKSSSTPNQTSPRGTGAANVPAVRACAAVLSTSRAALQQRPHSPQIGHRRKQLRRGCLPAQRRRA
jgi:hypothetical protein